MKKKRVSTGFCWVAQVMSQSSFVRFLFILIFYFIWTGPATRSTRSQIDPSGISGFNNYGKDFFFSKLHMWSLESSVLFILSLKLLLCSIYDHTWSLHSFIYLCHIKMSSAFSDNKYIYKKNTHTHTHTYIYIYIFFFSFNVWIIKTIRK
jgi:hypothetical protein